MFSRVIHCDWSMHDKKRWMCTASAAGDAWTVDVLRQVGKLESFVDELFPEDSGPPVLAGFDFPIGVPAEYGRRTGFTSFSNALKEFGSGEWRDFYNVAHEPGDIRMERPFYPAGRPHGRRKRDLCEALNFLPGASMLRECEAKTPLRPAGCCLFWTVGANQVGKGAISGWQEVIGPAVRRGAKLWPFDGAVSDLANTGLPVLAETYPAEAYSHIGIKFAAGKSGGKRAQAARAAQASAIFQWAEDRSVELATYIRHDIERGFGDQADGEDRFDALIGLLAMLEVVVYGRPEGQPATEAARCWEGWIMGMAAGSPSSDLSRFAFGPDDIEIWPKGGVVKTTILPSDV